MECFSKFFSGIFCWPLGTRLDCIAPKSGCCIMQLSRFFQIERKENVHFTPAGWWFQVAVPPRHTWLVLLSPEFLDAVIDFFPSAKSLKLSAANHYIKWAGNLKNQDWIYKPKMSGCIILQYASTTSPCCTDLVAWFDLSVILLCSFYFPNICWLSLDTGSGSCWHSSDFFFCLPYSWK